MSTRAQVEARVRRTFEAVLAENLMNLAARSRAAFEADFDILVEEAMEDEETGIPADITVMKLFPRGEIK